MADTPMREAADFLKRLAKDYDRDGGLPSSYCDKLNEIAERLAPSESAPTGWKLVPVEPTPQMIDRMEGIGADEPSPDGISWQEWQRRRWHWILAAAPKPNAAPQKDRSGPRLTEETAPAAAAPGRDDDKSARPRSKCCPHPRICEYEGCRATWNNKGDQ